VYAKPGFLQQVISICAACGLRKKKPMQLRTDAPDQIRGSVKIALLIAGHQYLDIAVRAHGFEYLFAIITSTGAFAQIILR
jgi:hypothetical protein